MWRGAFRQRLVSPYFLSVLDFQDVTSTDLAGTNYFHTSPNSAPPWKRNSLTISSYIMQTFSGLVRYFTSYHEWAWGKGKQNFPIEMFDQNVLPDAYIKHSISQYLKSITPVKIPKGHTYLSDELDAMKAIRPHAIITTNYDQFLEIVFTDYVPIVGQHIIQSGSLSVGELFKIHGCVSDPCSLVFTEDDYALFVKRKKYLSAKLLTFFSEHPLLFIGYSANDPNIRAILSDIDEALPSEGGVIPNVYILEWASEVPPDFQPPREKLIAIDKSKSIRVNCVVSKDFKWVFNAFSAHQSLNGVSPKVLRAILSRSYELVRHDIPRLSIQVDFQMLEHAVENQSEFAKLFGITTIDEPSFIAANYPYTISQVASKLRGNHWSKAQKAIDKIKIDNHFDIKSCDNKYQYTFKYGKSLIYKYSEDAVILLRKVISGEPYRLEIPGRKSGAEQDPEAQRNR